PDESYDLGYASFQSASEPRVHIISDISSGRTLARVCVARGCLLSLVHEIMIIRKFLQAQRDLSRNNLKYSKSDLALCPTVLCAESKSSQQQPIAPRAE